mgnify:FL=1
MQSPVWNVIIYKHWSKYIYKRTDWNVLVIYKAGFGL